MTQPWSGWHNSSERKLSWRNHDRNNTERVNLVLKMIENRRDEIYFLDSSCFMVNRPFQIFSFVSNRFTIRIRRPLVQSLRACLPGEMETWTEVAKHLREADYNAGATLGAFLLGFVIQFTLRKGGTQSTTQTYIWPPRVSPIASFS